MTRKQLEELGLTKEQADKIMEINGGDIEKHHEERYRALLKNIGSSGCVSQKVNRKKRSRLLKKTQKAAENTAALNFFNQLFEKMFLPLKIGRTSLSSSSGSSKIEPDFFFGVSITSNE